MKTNLLFATAILLSAATFGQQTETKTTQSVAAQATTIESRSNASVQAYASTSVKASRQAKSPIYKGQVTTKENTSANASLQANSDKNAGSAYNNPRQDASLNAGLNASSSDAKTRMDGLSKEAKATVQTGTQESMKTTASVKKEADKSIAETAGSVKAGASGIKQSVKPRPVSIKVHSQIKANAGIKIK
jgi:hypothetical protein